MDDRTGERTDHGGVATLEPPEVKSDESGGAVTLPPAGTESGSEAEFDFGPPKTAGPSVSTYPLKVRPRPDFMSPAAIRERG